MTNAVDLVHANAGRLLGEMLGNMHAYLEKEGDEIGPYRLCELLGAGGFGNVWRAEQTEPVRREVALKIIKLGMDTIQVLGRFNQERQALAGMDHPCIASMIDAGVGPDGRPYFAMELVLGVPITQWCAAQRPPVQERLRLFMQVCHAVQHAHQKGIIHRDLKPGNILVSATDAGPIPKVIDFGIAKAIHPDAFMDDPLLTQEDQMLGTPRYMSPEQIDGNMAIDTRSDIFSLGVLLYELLTGTAPFAGASTAEELKQLVREATPERPGTQLRRGKLQDGPLRKETLPNLPPDLDWITMRALEKDRTRRYQTAAEFAADVQRLLDHEPVLACPPSFSYVSSRWIRRHHIGFAAGCITLLAMIGGTGVALWQARVAHQAQQSAETEALLARQAEQEADQAKQAAEKAEQQTQQTADFLTNLFDRVSKEVSNGRNPEALKAALADSDQEILKLNTDPRLRIALMEKIEDIYSTIGERKLAIPLGLAKVREIGRAHGPESKKAREAELVYIRLVIDYGDRATGPGQLERLLQRVEATGERGSKFWLEVQRNLSKAWVKLDRPAKAVAAAEKLVAEAKAQQLSKGHMVLYQFAHAMALECAGKYDDAMAVMEEARLAAPANHLEEIERRVIYVLQRKGDYKRGAERLRDQLARQQARVGPQAPVLMPLLLWLAEFESLGGDHAAAIGHGRQALLIARAQAPLKDSDTTQRKEIWEALRALAELESAGQQHSDALAHAQESLQMAEEMGNNILIARSLRSVSQCHHATGDLDAAYQFSQRCYDRIRKFGANQRDAEQILQGMVKIRLDQNRPEEAMKLAEDLWTGIQARPETKDDPAHQSGIARTILTCYEAFTKAHPSAPEPPQLGEWKAAAGRRPSGAGPATDGTGK